MNTSFKHTFTNFSKFPSYFTHIKVPIYQNIFSFFKPKIIVGNNEDVKILQTDKINKKNNTLNKNEIHKIHKFNKFCFNHKDIPIYITNPMYYKFKIWSTTSIIPVIIPLSMIVMYGYGMISMFIAVLGTHVGLCLYSFGAITGIIDLYKNINNDILFYLSYRQNFHNVNNVNNVNNIFHTSSFKKI